MLKFYNLGLWFGAIWAYNHKETNSHTGYSDSHKSVFVFEMIRHGSRSHIMNLNSPVPPDFFGQDVQKGELTDLGRWQHIRRGLERRREYIHAKKFLSEDYNPKEIMSFSTSVQRCVESGKHFLHGLYPLQDIKYNHEIFDVPALKSTTFQHIIKDMDIRSETC